MTAEPPRSEINREFETMIYRVRHGPHRFGVLHTRTRELGRALYLRAFCHFDWPHARRYAKFLTDFRP